VNDKSTRITAEIDLSIGFSSSKKNNHFPQRAITMPRKIVVLSALVSA
jgi:hypothetical protein